MACVGDQEGHFEHAGQALAELLERKARAILAVLRLPTNFSVNAPRGDAARPNAWCVGPHGPAWPRLFAIAQTRRAGATIL
jgi:hypothetical protein